MFESKSQNGWGWKRPYSLFQAPCTGQGPLDPTQTGLEHVQSWDTHSISGQPIPGSHPYLWVKFLQGKGLSSQGQGQQRVPVPVQKLGEGPGGCEGELCPPPVGDSRKGRAGGCSCSRGWEAAVQPGLLTSQCWCRSLGQQDYPSVQNGWVTSVKSGSTTGEPTPTSCM